VQTAYLTIQPSILLWWGKCLNHAKNPESQIIVEILSCSVIHIPTHSTLDHYSTWMHVNMNMKCTIKIVHFFFAKSVLLEWWAFIKNEKSRHICMTDAKNMQPNVINKYIIMRDLIGCVYHWNIWIHAHVHMVFYSAQSHALIWKIWKVASIICFVLRTHRHVLLCS